MNFTSRAILLLVGSVHFSKYMVFNNLSARIVLIFYDYL